MVPYRRPQQAKWQNASLLDGEERDHGTDPTMEDTDGDGADDRVEVEDLESDPLDPDSDDDGMNDGFEAEFELDPNDAADAAGDADEDGVSNLREAELGINPRSADSDADGIDDRAELERQLPLDPANADTDGGGAPDGQEVNEDETDPLDPDDDIVVVELSHDLVDGAGFVWDIQRDGQISDGTNDAYDGGLDLELDGASFPSVDQANGTVGSRGRELELGPVAVGDLQVTRRIYVPDAEGAAFARFLEIIENPTGNDIETTVRLDTNLGSDGGTVLVADDNGDETVDAHDMWFIADDADHHWIQRSEYQFSTDSPPTRPNSETLRVTSVAPRLSAVPAMRTSIGPIGVPVRSRSERIRPATCAVERSNGSVVSVSSREPSCRRIRVGAADLAMPTSSS